MTILQPVTTRSPSTRKVLEESGLPFGFIVAPFAHRSSISNGDDDQFNETRKGNHKSQSRRREGTNGSDRSRMSEFPIKASLIAKCTQCGSPLNPACKFMQPWNVLCNLCGSVYDAHYDSQSRARRHEIDYYQDPNNDEQDHENYMSHEEEAYTQRYTMGYTQEERINPIIEYSLPLLSVPNSANGTNKREGVYALPSHMCSPLLAIFIDGTSSDAGYYARIASCLNQLIHGSDDEEDRRNGNDYKGARVGIFVMTKNGSLSVFDLTNPGGHLKHLWVESSPLPLNPNYQKGTTNLERRELIFKTKASAAAEEDEYAVAPMRDVMTAEQIFAPLNDYGISCIDNAIRELADSRIAIQQACRRNYQGGNGDDDDSGGVYLGRTLQYFLEFMEDVAYHPGDMSRVDIETNPAEASNKFMYAGGKIMCFLSKAPDEIGDITLGDRNGRIGNGGFGGSCAEVGKRFREAGDNRTSTDGGDHAHNPDDIESGAVNKPAMDAKESSRGTSAHEPTASSDDELPQTKYLGIDEYYHDLGMACAISAFGVELFALLHEDKDDDSSKTGESFIGMPFLRLLSDRSGGCGPLISKLPKHGEQNININNDVLMNEILARSPWHRTTAFGTMLRIRLPPSLCIDTTLDHSLNKRSSKKSNYQLHKYANNNGMHGSVTASTIDDELYLIGACDHTHSLAFDVQICSKSGDVDNYVNVDGVTDYRLKPCVQTCFAYTSVVKSRGEWITVRRLRVTTNDLDLTDEVETLTSALDSEALAVNLFHKFHANSLQNGLRSTENFAMNWLLSTLLCCYNSAKNLQKKIEAYGESISDEVLYAGDRLLDFPGSKKSRKDILLAQGHEDLQHLPLLSYALIQCDALRPNSGDFNPSIDARAAAAANMINMTPDALARCIAPRLEFWLSGKTSEEPVIESVNMSLEEVRYTIVDQIGTYDSSPTEEYAGPSPIIFLDSPSSVLIYDCRDLCNLRTVTIDDIPPSLLDSKNDALSSYRVPPPFFCLVGEGTITSLKAFNLFSDALVEDSITLSKHESYENWCTVLAEILFSEISEEQ